MAEFMSKYLFRACGHLFQGLKKWMKSPMADRCFMGNRSARLPKWKKCVEICFPGLSLLPRPMILLLIARKLHFETTVEELL